MNGFKLCTKTSPQEITTLLREFVKSETRGRPCWDDFTHIEYVATTVDKILESEPELKTRLLGTMMAWTYPLLDRKYAMTPTTINKIVKKFMELCPQLSLFQISNFVAFMYVLSLETKNRTLADPCERIYNAVMDAKYLSWMGERGYDRVQLRLMDAVTKTITVPEFKAQHLEELDRMGYTHLNTRLSTECGRLLATESLFETTKLYTKLTALVNGHKTT